MGAAQDFFFFLSSNDTFYWYIIKQFDAIPKLVIQHHTDFSFSFLICLRTVSNILQI